MTSCRYHCRRCEREGRGGHFTSLRAFDAHFDVWQDEHGNRNVTCRAAPAVERLAARPGRCRIMLVPADAVLVYEVAADAARARRHFTDVDARARDQEALR